MERVKGIAMITVGSMLWGATGPMMEWFLGNTSIPVPFFITIRLMSAGLLLLLFLKLAGRPVMSIWKQPFWAKRLLIYSIVGMLGVQYTFVASIEVSNAVIATLFQFFAPIFIILYVSLTNRKWPPIVQVFGILVTLGGLFLLLTNGNMSQLAVSPEAVVWGIAIGFTFAFYTLYPGELMAEWGVLPVVAWGMVIGGAFIGIVRPFNWLGEFQAFSTKMHFLIFCLIILCGTLAFVLFLSSMKYITPVETSILSSIEPLTAMIISVIWLGQLLGGWQLTGSFIMLFGVTYLSIAGGKKENEVVDETVT